MTELSYRHLFKKINNWGRWTLWIQTQLNSVRNHDCSHTARCDSPNKSLCLWFWQLMTYLSTRAVQNGAAAESLKAHNLFMQAGLTGWISLFTRMFFFGKTSLSFLLCFRLKHFTGSERLMSSNCILSVSFMRFRGNIYLINRISSSQGLDNCRTNNKQISAGTVLYN